MQGSRPSASDSSAVIVTGGVAIYATLSNPTMYDAYVQSGKSMRGRWSCVKATPRLRSGRQADEQHHDSFVWIG